MYNFLQKIKLINFRSGLDRLYFVLTLLWISFWWIIFAKEILRDMISSNEYPQVFLMVLSLCALPFLAYIVLIMLSNIFLWIKNGFLGSDSTIFKTVNIFTGSGSFFGLVKRHSSVILGIFITGIIMSLIASYFNYLEKEACEKRLSAEMIIYKEKEITFKEEMDRYIKQGGSYGNYPIMLRPLPPLKPRDC